MIEFQKYSDFLSEAFIQRAAKKGVCLTIGNFDGCHHGHKYLLDAAILAAKKFGGLSVVMTFSPRPSEFFSGVSDPSRHIFTAELKSQFFSEYEIDAHVVQKFDGQLASLTHEMFFDRFINGPVPVKALVIGHDFRFGKNRLGDSSYLARACANSGIGLIDLKPRIVSFESSSKANSEDSPVSSSSIRSIISDSGDVKWAHALLGHHFQLDGVIERGKQLGRKIGVPTANLGSIEQLLPARGVYAAKVVLGSPHANATATIRTIPETAIPAVVNIGVRPTVSDSGKVSIEAHLLTDRFGADELYDCGARLYFVDRIRPEMKFDGLPALKLQIQKDIQEARAILGFH